MGRTRGAAAAIAGGALWAILATLRSLAQDAPLLGLSWLSWATLGTLTPLSTALMLAALPALHRAHQGRTGALGRWGVSIAITGLTLDLLGRVLEYWVHGGLVDDSSPGATIGRLLTLLGLALLAIGLLVFGAAVQRTRVLAPWARSAPLLTGAALLLYFGAGLLPIAAQAIVPWLVGAGWIGCGLGLLALPPGPRLAGDADADSVGGRGNAPTGPAGLSVWRSFVSPGTLISALVAVAVWSLEWSWAVGALVVLLMYAHEAGHVLAAVTRGVRVERAPFFLPGFGAFIQTGRISSVWDEVWLSLGGPLLGSAVAVVAKLYGMVENLPALAHAGDFALLINAFNLVPFSPLDGGRTVARTGWLGFALTLALGGAALFFAFDLFIAVLVLSGVVQAYRAARERVSYGWGTRLAVLAIYLVTVALVVGAVSASGQVQWLPSNRPAWMPGLGEIFQVVFWTYLAGTLALPYAWRPEQSALVRYGIAALLGWPQYLLGRPWMIPVTFLLAGQAVGLAGARWLGAIVRRWAVSGNPAAGAAAAHGFDCLRRQHGLPGEGGGAADPAAAWLDDLAPALVKGGPDVLSATYGTLTALGYPDSAFEWLDRLSASRAPRESLTMAGSEIAPFPVEPALPPIPANVYAWQLLERGRAADALPYAQSAMADGSGLEPRDRAAIADTLGQTLLALRHAPEAEAALRVSLEAEERPLTRVTLARAVAQQGRLDEAIALAESVLEAGPWPDEAPEREEVERLVAEWRAASI